MTSMDDATDDGAPRGSGSRCTPKELADALKNVSARVFLDQLSSNSFFFAVLVCTQEGIVLYANRIAANGFPGETVESILGKNIRDISPPEWADERIGYIKRAIETQRTVTLIETLVGTRLHSSINPFSTEINGENHSLAFLVIEPISPSQLAWLRSTVDPSDLVMARVIDLGKLSTLTNREIEVLALMGHGLRQKQNAEKLHRSVSTIDRHRERIGEKLQITDRAELIAIARDAVLEIEDAKRTKVDFKHSCKPFPDVEN
ncbi:MAG: PAS domain-containing protein [Phycisphaerales bacterium]|nr:PAS domain-containing protein [Phycisphaerales bacterium]